MKLFWYGFIIGIGKVLPGISGSMIALSFGIYEEAIFRVSKFFSNVKENVKFLFPLCLGILASIILLSRGLIHFYSKYELIFLPIVLGMLTCVIPTNSSKISKNTSYFIVLLFTFFTFFILFHKICPNTFIYTNHFKSYITIIFISFLESFSTILPGVSGTALFLLFGYYDFILKLYANMYSFSVLLFFLIFVIFFGVIILKILSLLLTFKKEMTYAFIQGVCYSSLFCLFETWIKKINHLSFFQIILFFFGILLIFLSNFLFKKEVI